MKYTLSMTSGQYTASLWRVFMEIHGCSGAFQMFGFQEGRAMWEILPENSVMEGRPLGTTSPHGLAWPQGGWAWRWTLPTGTTDVGEKSWEGGKCFSSLQPLLACLYPMGWSLDRRWKQRNVAAMNPITRGSLGADWHIQKHFIAVWDAPLKIKLQ